MLNIDSNAKLENQMYSRGNINSDMRRLYFLSALFCKFIINTFVFKLS